MEIGSLLGGFVLTAIVYMLFPLIKLSVNQEKFERKQAKKIALWNSVVVGAIFFLLTIPTGSSWNPASAFLYYWINSAILTDKNEENDENEENDASPQQNIVESAPITHPPQISDPNEPPKTSDFPNVPANDLKLRPDTTPPAQEKDVKVQPVTIVSPLKPRFCRKCGFKLLEDSNFCSNCGTAVVEGTKNVLS